MEHKGQALTPCPRSSPLRPTLPEHKKKRKRRATDTAGKRWEVKKDKDKTHIHSCKGDGQTNDMDQGKNGSKRPGAKVKTRWTHGRGGKVWGQRKGGWNFESDRYVDSHTFIRTSQKPTQEQQEKWAAAGIPTDITFHPAGVILLLCACACACTLIWA